MTKAEMTKLNQNIEKLNSNFERLLNLLENSQSQGVMVAAPLVAEMGNIVSLAPMLQARGLSFSQEEEIATVKISNPIIAKQCHSDCFEKVAYNSNSRTLTVWFRGNRTKKAYTYEKISPAFFNEFMNAPSLGGFYTKKIKGYYSQLA